VIKIIWAVAPTVPFEHFWSLEFIGTMLSELLIPILVLVGSSIVFGVWGEKCAKFMDKLTKYLSIFSRLECCFDRLNFVFVSIGRGVSGIIKRIQTGSSNVNLLFLMVGICLLLIMLVIS
jgi:hypothetical protein